MQHQGVLARHFQRLIESVLAIDGPRADPTRGSPAGLPSRAASAQEKETPSEALGVEGACLQICHYALAASGSDGWECYQHGEADLYADEGRVSKNFVVICCTPLCPSQ